MEQNQKEQRCAAAKEFLQSLDQLEDMLQQDETEEEDTSASNSVSASDEAGIDDLSIDMEAFEDAVADIEQYIASKKQSADS